MIKKFLRMLMLVSPTLWMGCSGGSSANGGTIVLKFNLAKGSKFNYAAKMSMTISEDVMGNTVRVENKMGVGYIFEVTGDSSGWKTINSTIDRINMDMKMGNQSLKFDTDSPATDTIGFAGIMSKLFGVLKGGQFTFTMDQQGNVGGVYGMKEMMERMINSMNIPNAESITQSIGRSFDEKNFKQNLAQSFGVYPDKPVKSGDSWIKTQEISSNGLPIKSENTYTLISVQGDDAQVKLSSKLSSGTDSSSTGTKNVQGTLTGEMHYDVPTGAPLNGALEMKMNMTVGAQGQEIPVHMNVKTDITGKKM